MVKEKKPSTTNGIAKKYLKLYQKGLATIEEALLKATKDGYSLGVHNCNEEWKLKQRNEGRY